MKYGRRHVWSWLNLKIKVCMVCRLEQQVGTSLYRRGDEEWSRHGLIPACKEKTTCSSSESTPEKTAPSQS